MGKLKSFDLVFEDNKLVYYPGDMVAGKCVIELKSEIRLRKVSVCMRGVAKVHWTESQSAGTRGSYTEHYDSEVEYFYIKQLLYGTDDNRADLSVLSAGKYQLRFCFELPIEGISTSFEGKFGNIRYWLKAEVDKPWSFNYKTKKAFTVISPIDINKPAFLGPVENTVDKFLCCCFCRSGIISIDAKTDRKGYCPGESIALWAEFNNQSNRKLTPYATLHQIQTFLAKGKSRVRVTKYTTLTGLHINRRSQSTWDGMMLKIPAIPPTVTNCFVIRVEYFVKIALHIPGSSNLSMLLPIIIGTTPFRRCTNQLPAPPNFRPSPVSVSPPPPPPPSSLSLSSSSQPPQQHQQQQRQQQRVRSGNNNNTHHHHQRQQQQQQQQISPLSSSSSSSPPPSHHLHYHFQTHRRRHHHYLPPTNHILPSGQHPMLFMMGTREGSEPPAYNVIDSSGGGGGGGGGSGGGGDDRPPLYMPSDPVDIRDADELGRGWRDEEEEEEEDGDGDGDGDVEGRGRERYMFTPMYAYVQDYVRPPAYSEVDPYPQPENLALALRSVLNNEPST